MGAAFTPAELLTATGGRFLGTPVAVTGVFTDTREDGRGQLFVALRGERFDAHDFLDRAVAAGAAMLLIAADQAARIRPEWHCPALLVPDPLTAYQALAACHRWRFPELRVIGVTGSVGKTSVKEMLRAVCTEAAGPEAVLATEGNTNNQVGVPKNLLRLEPRHRYAVIEMGTNHFGEIAPLSACAAPDVALVNAIAPCHLEFLESLTGVAREKGAIYRGLRPGGTAVIPLDAPESGLLQQAAAGRARLTFGRAAGADFRYCDYHGDLEQSTFTLLFPGGHRETVRWGLTGEHQAANAAGAAAAATALGLPPPVIAAGLAHTTLPGMRMQRSVRYGATYLNDAYNASPESVKAVLRQLADSGCPADRLVLVLGDMLELGAREEQLHREVLLRARELLPAARLLVVGPRYTRALTATPWAGEAGVAAVADARFAAPELADRVRPGDTVLLKGSRGLHLEYALPPLDAEQLASQFRQVLQPVLLAESQFSDFPVWGVTEDSRRAAENSIFVAVPGARCDGATFAPEAVARGARLVVVRELPETPLPGVGYWQVSDPYRALALLYQAFHHFPDRELELHAVTGTNGKTTTAFLLHALDPGAGLISTVEYRIGDRSCPADRTTPPARRFFQLLRAMADAGCRRVFLEMSSHALDQYRTGNCRFATAIFTNLSGDHLDYHGTMERYFEAKKRLFTELLAPDGLAVLNLDDPAGRRLAEALAPERRIGFGTTPEAECKLELAELKAWGSRFRLGEESFTIPLPGAYNVHNAAGAVLAGRRLGFDHDALQQALATVRVPGRLETRLLPSGAAAVIDYAHTDDALRNVLTTLRPLTTGKLWVVFGCGGDRDRSKRPRMGQVALELADRVVVTSDNPRSEEPRAIMAEIVAGLPPERLTLEPDRRRAIELALSNAGCEDLILIAGKGHETTQEIAGVCYAFSDREVVAQWVERNSK